MPLRATRTIGTDDRCDITHGGIHPPDWAELRDKRPRGRSSATRANSRSGSIRSPTSDGSRAVSSRQAGWHVVAANESNTDTPRTSQAQPRLAAHADRVLHPEDNMPRGGISSTQASPTASITRDRSSTSATIRTSTSPCTQRWPPSQSRKGDCAFRSASSAPLPPGSSCGRYAVRSETSPEQWLSEQRGLGQGLLSDPAGVSIIER